MNIRQKLPLEPSQSAWVSLLESQDYAKVSALAPKTTAEAVQRGIPIAMLGKAIGDKAIKEQLEFDLISNLAMLNLNLTIKDVQYPFIVEELVNAYPNESIEDFQICFKRGVLGMYGKIYNIDLSVISLWMKEYLYEKYQLIESTIQKDSKESLPEVDYEAFKKRLNLNQEKKQPTREEQIEIMRYEPKPKEYVIEKELKRLWALECFDVRTGKPKLGHVSFEEWKKINVE